MRPQPNRVSRSGANDQHVGHGSPETGSITSRFRSRAAASLLLIVLALSASSCQWRSWEPADRSPPAAEEPVLPLEIDQSLQQELNCPAGNCQTRFRVQVDRPGTLTIVATPGDDQSQTSMSLTLEDSIGRVLDQKAMARNSESVQVSSLVQAGPHMVLARGMGGYVPYSIRARFRAGGIATQPWADPEGPAQPEVPRRKAKPTAAHKGPESIYDPTVNFHTLRKYAFAEQPQKQLQTVAGSEVGNPFQSHEVQRVLRGELTRRGFTQVPSNQADFLISSHVGRQATTWYSLGGLDHQDSYDAYDQRWANGSRLRTHSYTDHTLSLDFIDPRNGKLIWHGWTTEPESTDGERTTAIRNAVSNLLSQYPPR